MLSPALIANALLPILGLLGLGWWFRQQGWLDDRAENGLMQLVVRLFYPALIFRHVLGSAALGQPTVLVQALLTGSLAIAGGMLLALLVAPWFGLRDSRGRRTFAVTVGVFNFGYLALPLAEDLYGSETLGVMLAVNAGIEVPIWSLGLLLLSGRLARDSWRRALSPPLLALLVAAPLNLLGGPDLLPPVVLKFLDWAAPCAIPLGLVLTGSTFCALGQQQGRSLLRDLRPAWGAILLRLGVLPPLMMLVAVSLPLSTEVRQVAFIHAAMPCGIFPVVLARHYGGDAPLGLLVVAATCLGAVVTLPLWLALGNAWLANLGG